MMTIDFIKASWPAPRGIIAGTTTKQGGCSIPPYDSFNLATHVDDDFDLVLHNRKLLVSEFQLPNEPKWLNQVHGTTIVDCANLKSSQLNADAMISFEKNTVCAVLTADCLPLLVTDVSGSRVAAIHAGWRGLRDGIIEKTLEKLNCSGDKLLVWIGPAISCEVFEVDDAVRDEFIILDSAAKAAFIQSRDGHWMMDLVLLAKQRIMEFGIKNKAIYGGDHCSYLEQNLFYSYRRNNVTGRMASLIYIGNS